MKVSLRNEEQMAAFAKKIRPHIKPGMLIGLVGGLGAGKTTFVRHLVSAMSKKKKLIRVQSPTFGLIHLYECSPPIAHLDLYRLPEKDIFQALQSTGFEDYLKGPWVMLMEWSDRLPKGALSFDGEIHFSVAGNGQTRDLSVSFAI